MHSRHGTLRPRSEMTGRRCDGLRAADSAEKQLLRDSGEFNETGLRRREISSNPCLGKLDNIRICNRRHQVFLKPVDSENHHAGRLARKTPLFLPTRAPPTGGNATSRARRFRRAFGFRAVQKCESLASGFILLRDQDRPIGPTLNAVPQISRAIRQQMPIRGHKRARTCVTSGDL